MEYLSPEICGLQFCSHKVKSKIDTAGVYLHFSYLKIKKAVLLAVIVRIVSCGENEPGRVLENDPY